MAPSNGEPALGKRLESLKIYPSRAYRGGFGHPAGPVKEPVRRLRFSKGSRLRAGLDPWFIAGASPRPRNGKDLNGPARRPGNFRKKAIDGPESGPYMALHRAGHGVCPDPLASLFTEYR